VAFRVLFVCTGNICRSPLGERLLRARLGGQDGVVVESAGTAALALRELGADPEGHVARRLTADLVAGADLVLTAEVAHRSAVLALEPLAFRRTFTMREFARLGAALPPTGAVDADVFRARVAEVAAQRGFAEPAGPGADDIGDPFGAPIDRARDAAAQVSAAVDGVLAALGLARSGDAPD
jgi:protein-tyrosine phosphatase